MAERASGRPSPPETIHQLKITLRGVRPPIWRRIQLPSATTLGALHFVLQRAMGWQDYHLHVFTVGGEEYADGRVEDPFTGYRPKNEDRALLAKVAPLGARLRYEYDFGDGWEHDLVVEKVLAPEPGTRYPRCLAGRRACPPEDCGGPWGYAALLEAIANPETDIQRELVEWAGEGFDPQCFDLEALNRRLAPEPKARRRTPSG